MTFDAVRKRHLQSPPGFALHVDRRKLLAGESLMGIKKGNIEICPQRFATEIGDMDLIPWRGRLMPRKRLFRVVTRVNRSPVCCFDDDAGWLEDGALVLPREVRDDVLLPGRNRQRDIFPCVTLA